MPAKPNDQKSGRGGLEESEPTPWPHAVDGVELLNALRSRPRGKIRRVVSSLMPLSKRVVLARGYLNALGVTLGDLRPIESGS